MKRADWHIHLVIFLGSLFLCIVGYTKAIGAVFTNQDIALAIGGLKDAITGSVFFIVGACGILLQYYMYIKCQNE